MISNCFIEAALVKTYEKTYLCLGTFALVFARKQCILRSALCHKSYLTLPDVKYYYTAASQARVFAASRLREAARWQLKSVTEYTII